jgi:hypothetical protein
MKLKKKGFSAMLKGSTIDLIKSRARQDGISQATIIETAIDTYCNKTTDSETTSEKSFLHGEIEFKNNEINRLLETINQQNHLLAAASKKEILLIEDKKEPVKKKNKKKGKKVDRTSSKEGSTTKKDKKKSKKKGKGKK